MPPKPQAPGGTIEQDRDADRDGGTQDRGECCADASLAEDKQEEHGGCLEYGDVFDHEGRTEQQADEQAEIRRQRC